MASDLCAVPRPHQAGDTTEVPGLDHMPMDSGFCQGTPRGDTFPPPLFHPGTEPFDIRQKAPLSRTGAPGPSPRDPYVQSSLSRSGKKGDDPEDAAGSDNKGADRYHHGPKKFNNGWRPTCELRSMLPRRFSRRCRRLAFPARAVPGPLRPRYTTKIPGPTPRRVRNFFFHPKVQGEVLEDFVNRSLFDERGQCTGNGRKKQFPPLRVFRRYGPRRCFSKPFQDGKTTPDCLPPNQGHRYPQKLIRLLDDKGKAKGRFQRSKRR